ncbi:hypothetical protein BV22DRAFT_1006044 [Leucogyrophana mollusca]|uniref:Uncharacterized protein n=1 Tax=Leucogyrophana mollusca TaxID=85980 RepID=A0ACB8BS19_9AGAM|nr:hypothetical protein BV22DRAFT_1006044 [Leucogyrophana mollusca]
MPQTLSLPLPLGSVFDSDNVSESGSVISGQAHKFPHTRAQLSAIIRQHKPLLDNCDGEPEIDDSSRISSSFVSKVAGLLADEQEDDLKVLLKTTYGVDDESVEQHVLDLMHRHRDDVAGVPFLFLTPTRRPSRPSSRASSHSVRFNPNRPDTPTSVPNSPLAIGFRRPHTPAGSPLVGGTASSYMTARSVSPMHSPTLTHAQATQAYAQFTSSLPSSPISSPRLLSAKATEFKPIQRPLSAASSNPATLSGYRTETPSPDLWAHSPLRATSNLAIAAPLVPDHPRAVTPSSLRSSLRPGDEDEEEDPFDPFAAKPVPHSFHPITVTDFDQWSDSASLSPDDARIHDHLRHQHLYDFEPQMDGPGDMDAENAGFLTDGMTPLDVLSSVFGSTLAPSELEEALANNGYDFEHAMAWLVDRALPSPPQHAQARMQPMGGRVTLVSRDGPGELRGGRGGYQPMGPNAVRPGGRNVSGRPAAGGNRVCRYYLAGECLRADCRFSHDLERALCRFWLRGTCAKQDSCEFLHHLPKDVDVSSLTGAISRTNLNNHSTSSSPPPDEFPVLGFEGAAAGRNKRGGIGGRDEKWHHDPGRTRFAAAVKKTAPVTALSDRALATRREGTGTPADNLHLRTSVVAPRASPRLKLRAPALLPTLPTGESINSLYMSYRSRALQLGAARNACLSRAADAWRRGDGAAAKRFSREGHDLNAKMGSEMTEAAGKLVRERAKLAEQAVKGRDLGWSDDAGDRTSRGRVCGGGLGVCLGIASHGIGGDAKSTSEERTESMLDLHGLHSNEATEVLEEFLLALEREHFLGLAFVVVGEEKHTGTQDAARGASRARLAAGVREWLHRWGYPWSERDGVICVDPLTHA